MKRMGCVTLFFLLAAGLFAQQEPRINERGEDFTYAALACQGPYAQMGQKIGELMAEAGKQKLELLGGPSVIYFNSPGEVKPEELRWDVLVPVSAYEKVAAPLARGEYKYATLAEVTYKGAYDTVGTAYPVLMQFIAKSGYAVCGPPLETYLDDPGDTKPEECRTLIVIPVKK